MLRPSRRPGRRRPGKRCTRCCPTGDALLPVWESLDLAGCIVRWIPDWARISAQPQHNPIHRHTVDRHSVQCAAEVHKDLTQVERPDLLLLACLLHDIGKVPGAGADHAAVGAPIARRVAETLGLVEPDVAVVERLVRHHLTLAELATHRDHADPATLATLVDAVDGRLEMLNLLRRLTEADSRAAGPAAWSPWRAQLINALADRAEGQLVGEDRESRPPNWSTWAWPVRCGWTADPVSGSSPSPVGCRS